MPSHSSRHVIEETKRLTNYAHNYAGRVQSSGRVRGKKYDRPSYLLHRLPLALFLLVLLSILATFAERLFD